MKTTTTRGGRGSRLGPLSVVAAAGLACALVGVPTAFADDVLNVDVASAFVFSGAQLEVLGNDVLAEDGAFTDYTNTDGEWNTVKSNGKAIDLTVWTSGMVAGMFWLQYEATGDEMWKTMGERFNTNLEGVELLDDNDLGFQVLNSFGQGYRLSDSESQKEDYKERVLAGADSLYDFKWAGDIPAFWSWSEPSSRPEWLRAVNVDMIMNMEIMLWASVNGGNESYAEDVVGHADTTWKDIVRDDNSTFHVADYDLDTGDLVEQGTYQGWVDNSTWTRGHTWAIYGYAMIHRYLGEPRFLERSLGLLSYWEDNIPADLVPPTDFDAPVDADLNGKDSSASAVLASALFELFIITEDPTYLVKAQEYLAAVLSPDYYLPEATDGWQSILRRASARWGDPEVGAVFGDYFLLEAMNRYQHLAPSILLWQEQGLKVSVAGTTTTARRPTKASSGPGRRATESSKNSKQGGLRGDGGRGLQEATGGKFCALTVVDGKIAFVDPDCVPTPPDFESLESNTPSPAAVGASSTSSTLPSGTMAPTTAMAAEDMASAVFGTAELDSDLDMSHLDPNVTVVVWLSLNLGSTSYTPWSLVLESESGETLQAIVEAPAGGWVVGDNQVTFEVDGTALANGSWEKVTSVAFFFREGDNLPATASTIVAVNWLVVSNKLVL